MEVILKTPKDFNKMCRSCLNVATAEKDLFDYHLIEDNQLTSISTFFESVTSLKVTVGDGLPESICFSCYKSLVQANIYKNRCLDSAKKLKSLIKNCANGPSTETIKSVDTTLIEVIKTNFKTNILCKLDFIKEEQTNSEDVCELPSERELCNKREITVIDNENEPTFSSSEKPKNKENCSKPKNSEKQLDEPLDSKISKLCSLCAKVFTDTCALSLHYVKHTLIMQNVEAVDVKSGYLFCEICGQLFDCNSSLDRHYDKSHDGKIYWTCSECHLEFSTEMDLLKHNLRHPSLTHVAVGTTFPCSLCDEIFSSKEAILKHGLTHLVLKYNCKKCQVSFCTQESYNSHSKSNHGSKYICHICGKTLHCRNYLKCHIKNMHFSNQSHKCEICGKSFKTAATLKVHTRIHSTSKNFVCSSCGYSSHYQGDLQVHMRIHTKERPYKCTFVNCKKSFVSSSLLNMHVKTHLNIRKHKCSVCSSSFITNYSLKIHQRQHSDKRPQYSCPICPKKFLKKDSLRIHKKQHENIKVEVESNNLHNFIISNN